MARDHPATFRVPHGLVHAVATEHLLDVTNHRHHRLGFHGRDVEVVADDVGVLGAAAAQVLVEPGDATALGGGGRDDDDVRVDRLQRLECFASQIHHGGRRAGVELSQVRLVPDLVVAHAALVPLRHRPHVVAPALEIGGLGRGARRVRGDFGWARRCPRGRHAERKQDLHAVLARHLDVFVERIEAPLTRVRLEVRPRHSRVPQPPRTECRRPAAQRAGTMDVQGPAGSREGRRLTLTDRRAHRERESHQDDSHEGPLTAHRRTRWPRGSRRPSSPSSIRRWCAKRCLPGDGARSRDRRSCSEPPRERPHRARERRTR